MNDVINEQIKQMYAKAFYDIIDETINSDKPDYDWIVSLYTEIKERIIKYIRKDCKVYKQIDDDFDIKLFKQMIEYDVFNYESLLKLINNTFYWIKHLQAPIRDEMTEEAKQRILNSQPEKMVSTFIKEVNTCLDILDEDLINYIKKEKDVL